MNSGVRADDPLDSTSLHDPTWPIHTVLWLAFRSPEPSPHNVPFADCFHLADSLYIDCSPRSANSPMEAFDRFGCEWKVPLAPALIGDLFPYTQSGRPLGWPFGAMTAAGLPVRA